MIESFLQGLLQWAMEVIYALSSPFDYLINEYLPSVGQLMDLFIQFVNWVINFFPWVLSWFHIPRACVVFSCVAIIGYTTVSISAHLVKVIVRWWDLIAI